jgi:hypothetical protein
MTPSADHEAIRQTALDYFEGWFDGDAERMDRALHPELVKRCAGADLRLTTKDRMMTLTREGHGAEDAVDRRLEIEVAGVYRDIASVIVHSAVYEEYLHLMRTPEGWRITNTLYEIR